MSKKAKQFVFDTALEHIRNQGGGSYFIKDDNYGNKEPSCQYKYNGLGCAFAPMIAEYDESLENNSACNLVNSFEDKLYPSAVEAGGEFCQEIQRCHDSAAMDDYLRKGGFMGMYEHNMKRLAHKYKLQYTERAKSVQEKV